VEMINLRLRKVSKPVVLHERYLPEPPAPPKKPAKKRN